MMPFPSLRKDLYHRLPWVIWNVAISFVLNAATWIYVYFTIEPSLNPIPLHVTVYFGIDFVGPFWYFYVLAASGTLMTVFNGGVGRMLYRNEPRLAAALLTLTSVLNAFLCAITIYLSMFVL
ncbi:hypothetical protein A3I42_03505 [Candidatus Uhrbacteria bacterium RIFCSPLOWO2_02_FULL_49_11]|uniref:Uncharacterized protein n=1 Tax=Candidatus Uhrbacteria bacterium RIFCSPLOWO2_02_FULL_49_11 TaxID=1802409 RepID=A0A1F7VBF6_9BACT|nr:MAG: hypothetical protein A3I42_03505 [Candidatus Uhrbacteria bacterium RIFCSPLOWO2_02_FULL_49_11]